MTIIAFVAPYRPTSVPQRDEPCQIIILPVVRIERAPDNPHDAMVDDFARRTGRRRRRKPIP